MLSRTTAGHLSHCPGIFEKKQLTELMICLDGFQCTNCGLGAQHFSFEHITPVPVHGTYIAILNCDFCGLQIRVSPKRELV